MVRIAQRQTLSGRRNITISRKDLFGTIDTREFIVLTIYWGYTRGMRGNHFVNILNKIELLEDALNYLRSTPLLSDQDYYHARDVFKEIPGLGLSTYSKFLYFLGVEFDGYQCLILDQRLLDVFIYKRYEEFRKFKITGYVKEKLYLEYLGVMETLALDLKVPTENIEQFLFLFGNNLK